MTFRSDFVAGGKAIAPLLAPGATVGVVTGIAATEAGLGPLQAVGMSVIVYSPTVMLTALELLRTGTPLSILVLTSLTVGVRFAMLSLSIASYFSHLRTHWRMFLAYFLWTPSYALSLERYTALPETNRHGYYLGTAIPLWITFQLALLAGIAFGARVPARWQLGFVVPLVFIALLVRITRNGAMVGTAVVSGVLAVLGTALPLNLGIMVAATAGMLAGVLLDIVGVDG